MNIPNNIVLPINIQYPFPKSNEPSSFGFKRKYDIHTGIDLYCKKYEPVYAMENGHVVNIEKFTGEWADSPWWNNTEALLVEGHSGVICYGEIIVTDKIKSRGFVISGDVIGHVETVLKKDKGKNPMNMLHIELYKKGTTNSVWWKLEEEKPEELLDITELFMNNFDIK